MRPLTDQELRSYLTYIYTWIQDMQTSLRTSSYHIDTVVYLENVKEKCRHIIIHEQRYPDIEEIIRQDAQNPDLLNNYKRSAIALDKMLKEQAALTAPPSEDVPLHDLDMTRLQSPSPQLHLAPGMRRLKSRHVSASSASGAAAAASPPSHQPVTRSTAPPLPRLLEECFCHHHLCNTCNARRERYHSNLQKTGLSQCMIGKFSDGQ